MVVVSWINYRLLWDIETISTVKSQSVYDFWRDNYTTSVPPPQGIDTFTTHSPRPRGAHSVAVIDAINHLICLEKPPERGLSLGLFLCQRNRVLIMTKYLRPNYNYGESHICWFQNGFIHRNRSSGLDFIAVFSFKFFYSHGYRLFSNNMN